MRTLRLAFSRMPKAPPHVPMPVALRQSEEWWSARGAIYDRRLRILGARVTIARNMTMFFAGAFVAQLVHALWG